MEPPALNPIRKPQILSLFIFIYPFVFRPRYELSRGEYLFSRLSTFEAACELRCWIRRFPGFPVPRRKERRSYQDPAAAWHPDASGMNRQLTDQQTTSHNQLT